MNPSVLYVSISGFGEVGPYSGKPVYDHSSRPSQLGVHSRRIGRGAARLVRTVLPDKVVAITVAQTIAAGLYAKARLARASMLSFDA